jgi:hypothetical protein
MRYIILKTEVNLDNGNLDILGLSGINKKPSGDTPEWFNLKEAKTNCLNPRQCDILSFEDVEKVEDFLESSNMEDDETIVCVGVDV